MLSVQLKLICLYRGLCTTSLLARSSVGVFIYLQSRLLLFYTFDNQIIYAIKNEKIYLYVLILILSHYLKLYWSSCHLHIVLNCLRKVLMVFFGDEVMGKMRV